MGPNKFRILVPIIFAFCSVAFGHDTPTGMHISTKSPQAHILFEKGVHKMEMLHIEDGLENFRSAVKADPQFALGHIFLTLLLAGPDRAGRRARKSAGRA